MFEAVIPETVSEGYHTLHIYGLSGDEETTLDVYEFLPVFSHKVALDLEHKMGSDNIRGAKKGIVSARDSLSPDPEARAILGVASDVVNNDNASRRADDARESTPKDTLGDDSVFLFGLGGALTLIGVLVLHAIYPSRRNTVI